MGREPLTILEGPCQCVARKERHKRRTRADRRRQKHTRERREGQKGKEKKITYRDIGTEQTDKELSWEQFAEIDHVFNRKMEKLNHGHRNDEKNTQIQIITL